MKQLKNHIISTLGVLAIRIAKVLPANFSPLGSFGFFASNPIFYFLSIVIFDYFVGGFYLGQSWVYLAFSVYPLLGYLSRGKLKQQLVFIPLASFLFFLISNFGVWLNWYPRTTEGLFQCYLLALPFYSRTLMGDLFFGYGYLLLKQLIKNKSHHFSLRRNFD
jgi:hypothetical protein